MKCYKYCSPGYSCEFAVVIDDRVNGKNRIIQQRTGFCCSIVNKQKQILESRKRKKTSRKTTTTVATPTATIPAPTMVEAVVLPPTDEPLTSHQSSEESIELTTIATVVQSIERSKELVAERKPSEEFLTIKPDQKEAEEPKENKPNGEAKHSKENGDQDSQINSSEESRLDPKNYKKSDERLPNPISRKKEKVSDESQQDNQRPQSSDEGT